MIYVSDFVMEGVSAFSRDSVSDSFILSKVEKRFLPWLYVKLFSDWV